MHTTQPLEATYEVRFCETDALGHVSNTVLVQWFEAARDPVFRMFTPELDLAHWPLILAGYQVDFHQQMFYGQPVTIKTYIGRIGNSSFTTVQQVWQAGKHCATGTTTMVHFDYQAQRAAPIPDAVKTTLSQHLLEPEHA